MLLRLLLSVIALTMLLAACGDDDDDDDSSDSDATPASTEEGASPDDQVACEGDDQEGEGDPLAEGDTVNVEYCGTLDDGSVFDSGTLDAVTIGETSLIEGFTNALIGMRVGERKTVEIPVDQAYGESDPARIQEVPIEQFGGDVPPVGSQVQASNGATGTILEVTDTTVTVDFNHPLAGEDLTFEIEILELVS
jgi:FKBP-type peptidyl-prolyl cis-trans isomerase 2